MSMSEFEQPSEDIDLDLFNQALSEDNFPSDFSEDDAAFARELEEMFCLEQEDVPPLFAQTLLECEDARFSPVEHGFELKTRALVFQRLHLKRRLFRSQPSLRETLLPKRLCASRLFPVFVVICLLVITLSVLVTVPSFASGWRYLWAGSHAGIVQLPGYPGFVLPSETPAGSQATSPQQSDFSQLSLTQAEADLRFPLYFPSQIPSRYKLSDIYMYGGDQSWSDGPIIILDYTYQEPGVAPRQIAICEFKPQGKVLQVVQDGAAQRIAISPGNKDFAIYVEGQWSTVNGSTPSWVYNDRSELIKEESDGTVFWIVGDNRDGIDLNALSSIAASLKASNPRDHIDDGIDRIMRSIDGVPPLLNDDVIYLDNPNSPAGPSFRLIGWSLERTLHPDRFDLGQKSSTS